MDVKCNKHAFTRKQISSRLTQVLPNCEKYSVFIHVTVTKIAGQAIDSYIISLLHLNCRILLGSEDLNPEG